MNYPAIFFSNRKSTALASAVEVVPWILERINIKSVIDVGCGTASWLSVFCQHGVTDVLGIDGPWVPIHELEIAPAKFRSVDFRDLETLSLNRTYDLVISLEVAEHLPETHATDFVARLVALGRCIFFSAAAPGQGGVGHLNEQSPSYWVALFARQGFGCIDCIRGQFWDNPAVAPWYAQNAFFFVSQDAISQYARLIAEAGKNSLALKSLIHPRHYRQKLEELTDPRNYSLRGIVRNLPFILKQALHRRLGC